MDLLRNIVRHALGYIDQDGNTFSF